MKIFHSYFIHSSVCCTPYIGRIIILNLLYQEHKDCHFQVVLPFPPSSIGGLYDHSDLCSDPPFRFICSHACVVQLTNYLWMNERTCRPQKMDLNVNYTALTAYCTWMFLADSYSFCHSTLKQGLSFVYSSSLTSIMFYISHSWSHMLHLLPKQLSLTCPYQFWSQIYNIVWHLVKS